MRQLKSLEQKIPFVFDLLPVKAFIACRALIEKMPLPFKSRLIFYVVCVFSKVLVLSLKRIFR